jgi:ABC-type oligopeptide transport system substrate-binding subunit
VRCGISLAIDRKALASAYSVASIPHASPFSQYFTSLYLSEIKDLEKARELFAEGLKESDLSIKDVYDLELNVTPQNRKLAELLVSIINQNLSLNWHVKVENPSKVLSLIYQGKCDLSIFGWIDSIMDPRYYLEIFSSNVPMNHSNWSHPELQSLIQEMRTCSEGVESETLLLQAEKMLMKFTPMAPLFFTPRYSYAQSHLSVSKTEKRLDLLKLCKL